MKKERRIKLIKVVPEILQSMMENFVEIRTTDSIIKVLSPLPKGAKVINCNFDPYEEMFVFAFEHESFDPVIEGQKIPVIVPIYTELKGIELIENSYQNALVDLLGQFKIIPEPTLESNANDLKPKSYGQTK